MSVFLSLSNLNMKASILFALVFTNQRFWCLGSFPLQVAHTVVPHPTASMPIWRSITRRDVLNCRKPPQPGQSMLLRHKPGKNTCYIVELVVQRHVIFFRSNFSTLARNKSPEKRLISTTIQRYYSTPLPSIVYWNLPVLTPWNTPHMQDCEYHPLWRSCD